MALRLVFINATATRHAVKALTNKTYSLTGNVSLLRPSLIPQSQERPSSFFSRYSAEQLWKSVTSVSNAGKRRGRGKRGSKKVAKNLNLNQRIGFGKMPILFPGLNSPVLKGSTLVSMEKVDKLDGEGETRVVTSSQKSRRIRVHPLERGWTSATMCGKRIGPPDPIKDQTFENFDTIVLEFKLVNHMTNNMGRVRTFSCFAVTGNGNGLAGFALKKSGDSKTALSKVKNRAGTKVMYIERYNDHTVYHDFFTQFGRTKIFVQQKPKGYGLKCHRAIQECCKMIGITDLYAKVEGAVNVQNIVKAFFLGLINQRTHKELAEDKRLHLVEFRKENDYYPNVIASPSYVRTKEEIPADEILDFTQYVMDGKIALQKKKYEMFYTKLPSWAITMRKLEKRRNKKEVRLQMYMDYGKLRSFMSDEYPEAVPKFWKKNREQVEEETEAE